MQSSSTRRRAAIAVASATITTTLAGWALAPASAGVVPAPAWTVTPVDLPLTDVMLDDVATGGGTTWAVGTGSDGGEATSPVIVRRVDGSWAATPTPASTGQLDAIAADPTGDAWAAGVTYDENGTAHPLLLNWEGGAWSEIKGPDVLVGQFSDIALGTDGTVWVSGFAGETDSSAHAVVYQYAAGTWTLHDDGIEGALNGNELAVIAPDDIWLALNPGLAHFDGSRWTLVQNFPDAGSHILTSFAVSSRNDIWAAGVEHTRRGERPTIWHFDGRRWSAARAPKQSAQLYDIEVTSTGPIAVGEQFDADLRATPFVLALDGARFVETTTPSTDDAVLTGLDDVDGRLWTVGTYIGAGFSGLAAYADLD
ncbi:hypothetical protein [Nocardioides sp. NPDC006273]|uniref:hypothetical protein n=1 Tax=Nocardioides sp. NPDC006273 TaxID=3155598 RepID=UPI0033BE1AC0